MGKQEEGRLAPTIAKVVQLLGDNLSALSAGNLRLQSLRPVQANLEVMESLVGTGRVATMRCSLNGPETGLLQLTWPLEAAIALADGYRSLGAGEVRKARKALDWTAEHESTFEELAVLMTASIQEAVQSTLGAEYEVELMGQELVDSLHATEDADEAAYALPFTLRAYDLPPDKVTLSLPLAVAEAIAGSAIDFDDPEDDEYFEDFEPAEIRGDLAAYIETPDSLRCLRRACRRVGLLCNKRPKSEVPNPACYSKTLIVIEIGLGQARRYEWCRRLKRSAPETHVLLLIHKPTKLAVARAFGAGADAILGCPATERELSTKLGKLLQKLYPDDAAA